MCCIATDIGKEAFFSFGCRRQGILQISQTMHASKTFLVSIAIPCCFRFALSNSLEQTNEQGQGNNLH
jgi:hypothetical protein